MRVNLTPAQRREWQHPPLRRNVFALREFVTEAAAAVAAEVGGEGQLLAQIGDSFPLQLATVTVTFFPLWATTHFPLSRHVAHVLEKLLSCKRLMQIPCLASVT